MVSTPTNSFIPSSRGGAPDLDGLGRANCSQTEHFSSRAIQGEDVLVEQEAGVAAGLAQQCLLLLHVDLGSVHA